MKNRFIRITLAGIILPAAVVGVAAITVTGLGSGTEAAATPPPPAVTRAPAERATPASLGVSPEMATRIARCRRAVVQSDVATLRDIRGQLSQALDRSGDSAGAMDRYSFAYVTWRLNHALNAHADEENVSKEQRALLREAQAVLEVLLEDDPENAEAHALLGSVIGEQIGSSVWRGMRLGPKAGRAMDMAHTLAGDNPRVALQRGISFIFTPGMFGGGLDKAETELRRAVTLYGTESAGPWPDWGRPDAELWLARVLAKNGEHAQAREHFDRVLELEPDHHWVNEVLLPKLAEAEAKGR